MSVPRTDAEIIDETNALARYLCAELIGTGYQVPDDHKFYEAEDPRSKKAWEHAVKIMEMTTKTEMADVLATLDEDEPLLRTYGVRLHATMRAECTTEVEATSFAEAVEKAKALKHDDFNYSIDDTIEGDETIMVYGPADDGPDDDKWGGEGIDIDKRKAGEPFSWEACQLVKDLAALSSITNETFHREKMKELIARAKGLCTVNG